MAVVHPGSTLVPTKHELLAAWLPTQSWWPEGADVPDFVANFRFDDPEGKVGIETYLLPVADRLAQVAMTYRDAPLESGTLIGEMEHSALGHRWVYDGPTDPVYAAEVRAVILEGRGEVHLVDSDGAQLGRGPRTALVQGTGGGTGALHLLRWVTADVAVEASGTLRATWDGQNVPVTLAWIE